MIFNILVILVISLSSFKCPMTFPQLAMWSLFQFIQSILREGRYKNVSEAVRAGLRLLEEEEQKIIALRHAIDQGINSGLAEDFDPDEHLKMLKASRK